LPPPDEIEPMPMLSIRESGKQNSEVPAEFGAAHLEKLNRERCRTAEHRIEQNGIMLVLPLLVIVGAPMREVWK
jgi:hypothetical protein